MNKWVNNNNIAKAMALLISLILWAMVHLDSATPVSTVNQSETTRTIDNVKIQVYNFDEDKYVLYGLDPDRVDLVVSGKRARLTSVFSGDNYKVKLDLSNARTGTQTIPLTCELPNGVECVSITPSSVQVTIEEKGTTELAPTIVTEGQPAEGYQLGTPVMKETGKVKVTLPASEIGEVKKVQGIIDVNGITDDIKGKTVKLVAYDSAGQAMDEAEISPSTIEVDLPVIKPYKSVPVEIKTTSALPSGYALADVDSSVDQVVVYGPQDALDKLTVFPLTVDLGKFTGPEDATYTIELKAPEGLDKVAPDSLRVTIKATPFEKKTITDIPVTLKGVREGFIASVVGPASGRVSATVQGSAKRISALTNDSLSFSADLSTYGEGTFSVPLTPALPPYIYLEDEGNPPVVQVKITAKDTPAVAAPPTSDTGTASPPPASSSADNQSQATEPAGESDDESNAGNSSANEP